MSDYPDCMECFRPMRTARQRLSQHPGTVQFNSHGHCTSCVRRLMKAGAWPPEKQPRNDIDVTATMASLMAYLKWRAPYRAKVEQS
jgi:hypothetical protein